MDINEGTHIHSVRIFHFLGALQEYTSVTTEQIFNLIRIAKEREGMPVKYDPKIERELKELARLLS